MERFDITPVKLHEIERRWSKITIHVLWVTSNYRLTLHDDKVDFCCLVTETTKRRLVQKLKNENV